MKPRHAAALDPMMMPKEVAEYLHIHWRTLYRLIRRGGIPAFKVGGAYRFRRDEIDKWIAENERSRAH
ncbi:MAG: helix-turn-helix domain-containing protein [Candidatus Binataceae bacterium]